MKNILLLISIGMLFCMPKTLLAQIANWNFTGQNTVLSLQATTYDSGLSSAPILSRGTGAPATSGADSFRTTGFKKDGISLFNTDYFEFKLTPGIGKRLSLSSIKAKFSGTASFYASPGVSSQFAYSLDGTNFTLIGNSTLSTSLDFSVDLSTLANLQNIAENATLTLRYYASGQTTTGGWGFSGAEGLKINGTLSDLPTGAPTLNTNLSTINFSNQDLNLSSASKSYVLSGLNLINPVSVTANLPFSVSKDDVNYYTNITFSLQEIANSPLVYVKYTPITNGTTTNNITNSSIGANEVLVSATGDGVNSVSNIVISEIYGAGGNAGSTYKNDFIELYNPNSFSIDLTGWSVQYAGSTSTTWKTTPLNGNIGAKSFYLIQGKGGSAGTTNLPTPDATGILAIAAGAGKVLLANVSASQTGAYPSGAAIVDFVGFGTTANGYEGTGRALGISATKSIERKASTTSTTATLALGGSEEFNGNSYDSNNNNLDFVNTEPNPQNSSLKEPLQSTTSFLNVNPSILAFGKQSILNPSAAKNYEISAKNLSSLTKVSVDAPFSISKDNVNYTNSLNLSTADFATNQTVYVRFNPSTPGNATSSISHQSDGITSINLPLSGTGTDPNQTTFNFENCNSSLPDNFYQFSLKGAQTWSCTTVFGHKSTDNSGTANFGSAIQMNGYLNGNIENEDWLISAPLNLVNMNYALLSFWSLSAFSGEMLQLKVSTDYVGSGNPTLATWIDLNGKFPESGTNVWTKSGDIDLTAFKAQPVYIAFVYNSTTSKTSHWAIDDFEVINSLTPPLPELTTISKNLNFGFQLANTTSTSKQISFATRNLTGDVTITAPANFTIAKNNSDVFSSSITYTKLAINNGSQSFYVKFSPVAINSNYNAELAISTNGLTAKKIELKGNSFDTANTLDVVNWNIEWFGSLAQPPTNDDLQATNIKNIVGELNADVYGFAEVVDTTLFRNTVLPTGYNVIFSDFASYADNKTDPDYPLAQKLAFMYRTANIKPIRVLAILQDTFNPAVASTSVDGTPYKNWSSGRFPFLMEAEVNINGKKEIINFIEIHAKANTGTTAEQIEAYNRRKNGSLQLKTWINQNLAGKKLMIIGDFNDVLEADKTIAPLPTGTLTSYTDFITDTENYFPVSVALSTAGGKTTASFPTVIDNVIINKALNANYIPQSIEVLEEVKNLAADYATTTSDHYPVKSRYLFGNGQPTLANIIAQTTCFTTTEQSVLVEGISAGQETNQTISLSVSTNKPDMFELLSITPNENNKAILNYKLKNNTTESATITVTVTDNGGTDFGGINTINKTFTLNVNSKASASVSGNSTVIQNSANPSITFTAMNGTPPYTFTYNINGGTTQTLTTSSNSATLAVPTTSARTFVYNLTHVSDVNCSQTQIGSATILIRPLPLGSISGNSNVCINGLSPIVTFKGNVGSPPFTFTYNINGGTNKTISTNTNTTTLNAPTNVVGTFNYNLISISDNYAINPQNTTALININPLPMVSIKANGDTIISKGSTLLLLASGASRYVWSPLTDVIYGQGTNQLSIRPKQSTTYTVKGINDLGCETVKSIYIKVEEDFYIKPINIITPNGDGKNDKFIIENIDYYPNNTVKIFDKSGKLIYTKKGYLNEWDGTYNGTPLETNTYYYLINFEEKVKPFKGAITLIRN